MFKSVLIANRGEIACRIARTAKRLGLRTIAVYSEADSAALHVRLADEAHPIGPAPAADSYLRINALIAAAKQVHAQCIHPGYGFLAENADFAQACIDAGIVFVGPKPAAPVMSAQQRAAMGEAAVAAAKAAGYEGAGTVEFIADGTGGLKQDRFWFMEMNTRLQVEHPVTEAVTGLDLVEWQFRIAAGEKLPLTQAQVPLTGHAVEARLYAEDPERGFLPSTGRLIALKFPQGEGLRIDTGVEQGSEVTPFYDPMLAKLIAHGNSRHEALDRLAGALDNTIVVGPRSNAGFLAALCRAEGFRKGDFDTGFIDRNLAALGAVPQGLDRAAAALGTQKLVERESASIAAVFEREPDAPASPWDSGDAFQLSGARHLALPILTEGESIVAQVAYGPGGALVAIDGIAPASDAVALDSGAAVYVLR